MLGAWQRLWKRCLSTSRSHKPLLSVLSGHNKKKCPGTQVICLWNFFSVLVTVFCGWHKSTMIRWRHLSRAATAPGSWYNSTRAAGGNSPVFTVAECRRAVRKFSSSLELANNNVSPVRQSGQGVLPHACWLESASSSYSCAHITLGTASIVQSPSVLSRNSRDTFATDGYGASIDCICRFSVSDPTTISRTKSSLEHTRFTASPAYFVLLTPCNRSTL